jgi:hypothetical protein
MIEHGHKFGAWGQRAWFFVLSLVLCTLYGRAAQAGDALASVNQEQTGPSASAESAAEPAATEPPVDHKEVLDFCYMSMPRSTTRSQKQRLVLFGLAGREVAFGPEQELDDKGNAIKGVEHHVLRDVGIDSHARSVFRSGILMDRFFTVEASIESPKQLAHKPFLSDQELLSATQVDAFAAYSLACTDWVVLPRITEKTAEWRKVKKQHTVNGHTVERLEWELNLVWKLEADVYRRSQSGFTLAATVDGSNGGALGMAFGLAAAAPHRDPGGKAAPLLLSKRPQPGCNPPLLPELSELAHGMTSCAGALSGLADKAKHALDDETNAVSEPKKTDETATPPADGNHDAATEEKPEPLSDDEKDVLKALAASDTAAMARLLALGAAAKHPAVVELVTSAKGAADSCQEPIKAVSKVSQKLHDISQKGPAAMGLPVLLGLASCAGIDLDVDLSTASPPGTDELESKFCTSVDPSVSRGESAMQQVGICSGRVGIERSTLAIKKHVKELDGIRMFAHLMAPRVTLPAFFGIALGKSEGVERGDAYVAYSRGADGQFRRSGFGRIQEAGPGGEQGEKAPSQLKLRSQGDADVGARVEEHPQIGVPLSIEPRLNYYLLKGDLNTGLAVGGAIEGGYNASKFVPAADEVWGRAALSLVVGAKNEMFATIELGPDVVHYLGGGFAARAGTGFAYVIATKSVDTTLGTSESLTGYVPAAYLNGGLEYAFDPDWAVRLSAGYRQGLGSAKLENKAKTLTIDGGTLSAAQLGLLAGYTF